MQLCILSLANGQDISDELMRKYQYDVATEGQTFLLNESKNSSYFLLGELHGEKEIPQLLYSIWPEMNKQGYSHIVAELSPWSADKLEFGISPDTLKREVLWSNREAKVLRTKNSTRKNPTIWGCDMEEISIELLFQALAKENPGNLKLKKLVDQLREGYNRKLAPTLLDSLRGYRPANDITINGMPLYASIIGSLKIDSARAFPDTRLKAQIARESMMKTYFYSRYKTLPAENPDKLLFRFGRNHLHRGFDSRGISTLGNFVSELAFAKGLKCFNVAAFAAGGKYSILDESFEADERSDDIAFQFFWEQAKYDATVFDLRPIRDYLHTINSQDRSELHKRLLYWADSYDAIICYKTVTPLRH